MGGTIHKGLGPPITIVNEENAPTHLPTDRSYEGVFSVETPSSKMTLACVELTETKQQHDDDSAWSNKVREGEAECE